MAAYPNFSIAELSAFSGRPASEYTNAAYVPMAITQAELLFKIGTCLGDYWPDDPTSASLAQMAILSMADAIYLAQPFQTVLASPFSSETIGSYSYNKVSGAVLSGVPTGVTWFDLAVSKLGACDLNSGVPIGGGIEIFESDGLFTQGQHAGNVRLLSPSDFKRHQAYAQDPSEGFDYGFGGGISVGGPPDESVDGGSF